MTKIKFNVPVYVNTKVTVHDILGREVVTLIDEKLVPGVHEIDFDATGLAEGVYFYKIETKSFSKTRKINFNK